MSAVDNASFEPILSAWGFQGGVIEPIEIGLINRTFRVESQGRRWILQCLNPLFDAKLHRDIEAITTHIAAKGLTTPRLQRTRDGDLWLEHDGIWRVFDYLAGHVVTKIETPRRALEAGRLVARFHGAVSDLEHAFHFTRPGVHDMAMHRGRLETALRDHRAHVLYDRVAPLANELLEATRGCPDYRGHPMRIAHGDLKISNVLFADDDEHAVALLDLDTMARMPLAFEMGDAFRSWCNPGGEDQTEARFDAETFRAAITGYREMARAWITEDEWSVLVEATRVIALELATRFCADALNERYFGWNAARYASRGEHNLVRASGQYALAQSIASQRSDLERLLREV